MPEWGSIPGVQRLLRRVLGPPPFDRLSAVHAVSTAADACITVSLAGSLFFSVSVDAARPRLLLYLVLTLAPFALVAPFIDGVVRQFRGALPAVIAFCGQGRAVLSLFMVADLRNLLLYPESFGVLVLGKLYSVVKSSLVPVLRDDESELVAANAHLSRLGAVSAALGGGLAAGMLAVGGTGTVLRVAAVAHLVGAALALRIPRRPADVPGDSGDVSERTQEPRVAVLAMGTMRLAVGLTTFLLAFALKREGAVALAFGGAALAAAVGNVAGTFVSPLVRRHWMREQAIMALALVVGAGLVAASATSSGVLRVVLVAGVIGFVANVARQAFDSLLQQSIPEAERPRAFARNEARFQLVWVAGAVMPTALDLPLVGGLLFVAALLATVGVLVALRATPRPVADAAQGVDGP